MPSQRDGFGQTAPWAVIEIEIRLLTRGGFDLLSLASSSAIIKSLYLALDGSGACAARFKELKTFRCNLVLFGLTALRTRCSLFAISFAVLFISVEKIGSAELIAGAVKVFEGLKPGEMEQVREARKSLIKNGPLLTAYEGFLEFFKQVRKREIEFYVARKSERII